MIGRMELEINNIWAEQYPSLFMKSLKNWFSETTSNGLTEYRIDKSRSGFVTYIAEAK